MEKEEETCKINFQELTQEILFSQQASHTIPLETVLAPDYSVPKEIWFQAKTSVTLAPKKYFWAPIYRKLASLPELI